MPTCLSLVHRLLYLHCRTYRTLYRRAISSIIFGQIIRTYALWDRPGCAMLWLSFHLGNDTVSALPRIREYLALCGSAGATRSMPGLSILEGWGRALLPGVITMVRFFFHATTWLLTKVLGAGCARVLTVRKKYILDTWASDTIHC